MTATKFGLQIFRFDWAGGTPETASKLRDIATTADEGGLDTLWVMDHFFQMGGSAGPIDDPMLEAYTTLGMLAGITSRIELGALVTGYLYRYPGVLGKTVTTLDVLSGGRSWLGIGAGWYDEEALGLGTPFPRLTTRFEQLEETLAIVQQMWDDDDRAFDGQHFRLERPINRPQPLRRPPILIGGEGPTRTMRLVARYADACNWYFGVTDPNGDEWQHNRFVERLEHLRKMGGHLERACDAVGRDPSTVERTALGTIDPGGCDSADRLVDIFGELADAGIDHIIVNMNEIDRPERLELLIDQVLPQIRART